MKRVFIIRHGQTDYNLEGIVQGSGVDASLNDTGKSQAFAFYKHFRSVPFDKVYTSTLRRTHETVSHFVNYTPHEAHRGLNEISWGSYEGKKGNHEEREALRKLVSTWRSGELGVSAPLGESPLDVAQRQREFLPLLLERNGEKNVLVCTHGRAMRVLLCVLLQIPLVEMDRFSHQNLCLYELEYSKSSRFRLVRENYTGHLLG